MTKRQVQQNKETLIFSAVFYIVIFIFAGCAQPKDGQNGLDGVNGRDGKDGKGCTVTQLENGARIDCDGATTAVILNGKDGEAPEMHPVIKIIDPCGKESTHDEVILQLSTGELIGHFSDKGKEFLTVLVPGFYVTTDFTKCEFRVHNNYSVTW